MDKNLLELYACPRCYDRPALVEDGDRLLCIQCRRTYPIVDGVPHLVADEAASPEENDE